MMGSCDCWQEVLVFPEQDVSVVSMLATKSDPLLSPHSSSVSSRSSQILSQQNWIFLAFPLSSFEDDTFTRNVTVSVVLLQLCSNNTSILSTSRGSQSRLSYISSHHSILLLKSSQQIYLSVLSALLTLIFNQHCRPTEAVIFIRIVWTPLKNAC